MQRYKVIVTVILMVCQTVLSSENGRSNYEALRKHEFSGVMTWKHKVDQIANFLTMIEEPSSYQRGAEFDITCNAICLFQEEHREKLAKLSSGMPDKMILVTWVAVRRRLLNLARIYNYQTSDEVLSRLSASDYLIFKHRVDAYSNYLTGTDGYVLPRALRRSSEQ